MKFSELKKEHIQLVALSEDGPKGPDQSDAFWKARDAFKTRLYSAIVNDEFLLGMTKRQVFRFLAWCSSYRPCEPHSILIKFAQLSDKIEAEWSHQPEKSV